MERGCWGWGVKTKKDDGMLRRRVGSERGIRDRSNQRGGRRGKGEEE